jgi:hypothetical protein
MRTPRCVCNISRSTQLGVPNSPSVEEESKRAATSLGLSDPINSAEGIPRRPAKGPSRWMPPACSVQLLLPLCWQHFLKHGTQLPPQECFHPLAAGPHGDFMFSFVLYGSIEHNVYGFYGMHLLLLLLMLLRVGVRGIRIFARCRGK